MIPKYRNIDIVLPCYNPPNDWVNKILPKYEEICQLFTKFNFHLYIVNDGSKYGFENDNVTYLIEKCPEVRIISYQLNHGKGFALRKAVEVCESPYIIYTDYDFPYTLESYSDVIKSLVAGADIVLATRGGEYHQIQSWRRRYLSYASHFCNRWLLHLKFHDTQGGLKAFNKKGCEVFLTTKIDTYLIDAEFILKASRKTDLYIQPVLSHIRTDITLSNLRFSVCLKELLNLFYLILYV